MKIRKKNKIIYKEAVKFSIAIILALFLVTSIFFAGIPASNTDTGSRAPKTIWGYVTYCSGGAAIGASVVVHASGYPDETDTTDSLGAYQVDVGPDTGTEWPDGTSFTVTVTLGSWSGSNTGTVSGIATQVDVVLYPPTLVADADANPTTVLVGETVNFYGSATGGAPPYSYSWNFGDGSPTSNLQNPTHSYSTTGTKTVVLTVTDSCSSTDTDTIQITVNPPLTCSANGPYSGYVNQAIQFTGTASGGIPPYSWSWTFGDTGTSTQQNPTHTYTGTGTFTVTLTVTDSQSNVCNDGTTAEVTLEPVVAHAGGPYSGTLCDPVQFYGSATGGSTPYTWDWDFGDDTPHSNQQNPTHQYTEADTYTVTLTVTDSAAQSDSDTTTATITYTNPTANAHGPYSGTKGTAIQFTGTATGGCTPYTWDWNFGDSSPHSNQQNPKHTYTSDGVYTVTLTVTDNVGGTDSDTTTATISPDQPLKAYANGPYYGKPGEAVYFTGSASGGDPPYLYYWDFGDGATSQNKDAYHTYTEEGVFTVILTVQDSKGATATDTTTATISSDTQPLQVDAGGPYTALVGETVSFTGLVTGGVSPYAYHWDFDDGNTSNEKSPTHEYTQAGTYTVTFTVTDNEDTIANDTATVTITADITPPTLTITIPLSNSLYIGNNRIIPFPVTLIIGSIDVTVEVSDETSGISQVIFYLNGENKHTATTSPYTWAWNERTFGKRTIKVEAYDNAGNSNTEEITVWRIL
jgi:PKD repeat protein